MAGTLALATCRVVSERSPLGRHSVGNRRLGPAGIATFRLRLAQAKVLG